MEFIDNTGHLFSLNSYEDKPISLEYNEGDYIFWIKDSAVSINNYYIKPIRFLIEYNVIEKYLDDFDLEITNDSKFYKLISPKYLQNKLENISNISKSIDLDKSAFVDKLTLNDFYFDKRTFKSDENTENLIVYSNSNKFVMFPFYVIGYSDTEGTFINNITIKYKYKTETEIIRQLSRNELYDYLIKQTFSNINIYKCNQRGENKELVATIYPSYDENYIIESGINEGLNKYEILYKITEVTPNIVASSLDKNEIQNRIDQKNRIRNFSSLPSDVYHYIYRLDHELEPGYYIFEGEIYDGCKYCGSVLGINHDGYLYDNDYIYERFSEYQCGRLNPICDIDYQDYENGYILKDNPIYLNTPIADIWFDVDNEKVVSNENGASIIEYKDAYNYTLISVGCTFIDECEELIINGKNMGLRFPKEILKAVYNSSYYSKYADEKLLKNKLKELLLNYMNIKGQCGNVKSMINSLKWFGWNNHIEISKLLKTDNQFQNQFILDYFDIDNDIKETFKYFNNTNNISLSVLDNIETGENYNQDFNDLFYGEGKPVLEDLFNKNIEVIKENISFYKPYYNFIFNELALKLDCLKYYYQQYFLPIHINILRASVNHKVYANTVKFSTYANDTLIDSPLYLLDNSNITIQFPDTHILLFKHGNHLIDSKYNEFSNYNNNYNEEDLYYINENCISIPFTIIDLNNEYSINSNGDYIKENEEYIKINYFFKRISDELIEESDQYNATHYSLTGNLNDLLELKNVTRYIKLSEGYFKCKLYLTVTFIEQSDKGHYIYKDGKYIYKENFYKDNLKYMNISEDVIDNYIDDSYDYILYYNDYIKIDKKDRYDIKTIYLINDNNFNYFQNSNQYYKNLVIVPRIINYDIDWLSGYYRLSISVNDKWFYYDFTIKTPNIYLDLGKLEYKYSIEEVNEETTEVYYPFKQLRSLNPLRFNSFIFQPDLVTINSLFKDEENNKLLTFIDKLLEVRDGKYTMAEFYKKYYRDKIIIPYNEKYFNRIHLFELYHNGEKIVYNTDTDYTSYYVNLFNNDCSFKIELNENVYYDYYLMHDDKEWYIVVISQYPIASYLDKSLLDIHQDIYKLGPYTIKYANYSIDKFLINRMNIIKSNGVNHFNVDDLIIASLNNNDYQFNIDLDNKWSINKIYDTKKIFELNSNSNIAIITNNNKDNLYTPGYYNLQLNYTISGIKNLFNKVIGEFKVEKTYQNIEYPILREIFEEKKTYNVKDTISDGTILYINDQGERKYSKDFKTKIPGYHPIGIKIVNAGYFSPESPAIYMGLKHLSIKDPENGYKEQGNQLNFINNYPYFGMAGIEIPIKTYDKICYFDETHTVGVKNLYPPTDDFSKLPNGQYNSAFNEDGTPKWPAPNDRAYRNQPTTTPSTVATMTVLNDDDTLNMDLLDEDCALLDWDGKTNNEIIKNSWYDEYGNMKCPEYADWESVSTMYNPTNKSFSPAVACALRYHTVGTEPGDWYVPSYACVFFMIYNFKKYSEIFENLNRNYPDDCKPDLLEITSQAFYTCTFPSKQIPAGSDMWDIHVCNQLCHIFSRSANWYTIPFINIDESDKTIKELPNYNYEDVINDSSTFDNCIFKYEDIDNDILDNFTSINFEELSNFNEYNIRPFSAHHFGIYRNNRKIGILNLWEQLNNSFDERKYRIGLMSDIHYNDMDIDTDIDTYYDSDNTEWRSDIENALTFYQEKEDVSFICASGDITTNNIEHALNFKQVLNTFAPTTPFYSCLGNHDYALDGSFTDWSELSQSLDVSQIYGIEAWLKMFVGDSNDIHYEDPDSPLGRTSFWIEKNVGNTNKKDIFVFLSVNYNSQLSARAINYVQEDEYYQDIIEYVGFTPSKFNLQFYNNSTLIWLKNLLEENQNKRIFIFTHQFFIHKAGSNNTDNEYYHYGGIGDEWRIQEDNAYCLCGLQFEFLNKLNNEYKNTIWFTGHSHYKWNWQTKDPNININNKEYNIWRPDDDNFDEHSSERYLRKNNELIGTSGFNIHIPSTVRPLQINSGYFIAHEDSEGAILDIYENYVDIRGVVFKEGSEYTNKYYPLAQYRINIPAR